MFTGIIRKTAHVEKIEKNSGGISVEIVNPKLRTKVGDSISVNGVCSTTVKTGGVLKFQYMPETVVRSTVGFLEKGDLVNLEESLRASDRLGGHIVLGHVDTVGMVKNVKGEGGSRVLTIHPRGSQKFMSFIAAKGSVALDGVSLTVVSVGRSGFTVKLIPYTLKNTNLGEKTVGSFVNVEFDILAKYLKRICR